MRLSVIVVVALVSSALAAQEHGHPVPGLQQLGTVRFATSCSPGAHADFARGVALLHSFAFSEAAAAFNDAVKTDSECAIAYWGLSLCAWGNPFAAGIKPDAQLRQGLDAIERGKAAGAKTARERDYRGAASRLFEDFRIADQSRRLSAYRDEMGQLAKRYPDDSEASIFYSLALAFSADPTDKTYADQLKAGAILESLTPRHPGHPGLAHYVIHTYDVPSLASRALDAARRYATLAPGTSHALHMPSHTFIRLGLWQDAINTNIASAASARREGSTAEELHASDYLMYAYLQSGQDRKAQALLAALPAMRKRFDPSRLGTGAPPAAGYFAIAAIPARYALERGAWDDAATLAVHQTPFPFTDAISYFARALGAARLGNTAISNAAIIKLQSIAEQLAQQKEMYWSEQVEIQRRGASAWVALAEGRTEDARATMREAAEREDATEKNVITPGPLAPARELLGEMLLQLKQPAQALKEFEKTLTSEPNRIRALAGAGKAAAAVGDRAAARRYYGQLVNISARADQPGRKELREARRWLERSR